MEHVYTYLATSQLPVGSDITNSYPGITLVSMSEEDWNRARSSTPDFSFLQNYVSNPVILEQSSVDNAQFKSMAGKLSQMYMDSMHLIVIFDSPTDYISIDITNWVGGEIKDDAHNSYGVIEIYDDNGTMIQKIHSKALKLGEVDTITWKSEPEIMDVKYLNLYGKGGTGYGSEDYAIYVENLRYNNFSDDNITPPSNIRIKK